MTRRYFWVRNLFVAALAATIAVFPHAAGRHAPVLGQVDFAVHETGHLIAGWLPSLAMFMAGSIAQVAVPLALAAYFGRRQVDGAAVGLCLAWAGESTWGVSMYAGDAVAQRLPIVGGEHDWAYILGPDGFDALAATGTVARAIEIVGLVLVVAGVVVAVWSTAMAARHPAAPSTDRVPSTSSGTPVGADPWRAAAHHPGEAA